MQHRQVASTIGEMIENMGDQPHPRSFDGIVCIGGEDWWYHNRGHFDFQIMRRLARNWPVLFVNSLAVRMPSLADKGLFATRIQRKLNSLSHGLTHVENGFSVYSVLTVPGATGQKLSSWAVAPQIRIAAARAGIKRPVLWVHCPAGALLTEQIASAAVVLQRTDRFESFPEADPAVVTAQIRHLKARADLTIYAAEHLMREEAAEVKGQLLVTHGVDVAAFTAAGLSREALPHDIASIAAPRVGFIGGIDHHTFDPELFLRVAGAMRDVQFVMVGGSSLPEDWCTLPNVTFLGRKPYEQVAAYMAAMNALIMPWNRSPWIEACNPIKLKEYLAVGRPVVSTDFPALEPYRDLVLTANEPEAFVAALRRALSSPFAAEVARARVSGETWDAKAQLVHDGILGLGLEFAATRPAVPANPAGPQVA